MAGAVYHKPVGQNGGHKTPFTDIRGLQLILLSLRGKVAQQYRSMLNEIFLRYTAGDRSMIQEIEQNAISEEPLNVLARETLAVDSALEEEESVVVGRKRLVSETAEKTAQNLQLVHHNAQQAAQSVLQVNQAVQQLSQSLQLAGDGAEAYAKGINSISQATKDHQDTIKDIGFDSSGDRMMYILKVGTFVADMAPILGPAAGNSFAQAAMLLQLHLWPLRTSSARSSTGRSPRPNSPTLPTMWHSSTRPSTTLTQPSRATTTCTQWTAWTRPRSGCVSGAT